MQRKTIRTFLSIIGTVLFLAPVKAAELASDTKATNINPTLYMFVGLVVILLFIIGMLGHTLLQLSSVVKEKNRKDRNEGGNKAGLIVALFLAFLLPVSAYADDTKAWQIPNSVSGLPFSDFCLLVIVLCLELLVIFFLAMNIQVLLKVIKGEDPVNIKAVAIERKNWFWDIFNKAASVEKEREILLDHNYDGIQELDNSLPPWWKYGFYLTIIVAIIYLYRFHVSHSGLSQREEYVAEMQKGEEDKAEYLAHAANNVDETNVKQLTDATSLSAGKEIFEKNCAPCHLADGGGNVGLVSP